MIYLYTGTPGSGKSLHLARLILNYLNGKGGNVIANFDVDRNVAFKSIFKLFKFGKHGEFFYYSPNKLTVSNLIDYSKKYHVQGKENQTLLCIDECQTLFNPREFQRKDRLDWNNFFSQHRKLGFEVILVTQTDRLIDRQIRALVEYEVKHRKVNNFKIGKLLPFPCFCAISYWYGVRERLGCEFFPYSKKLGNLYDSYKMFEKGEEGV